MYWLAEPTLEPAGQVDAVDSEQATFERILERTVQESRSGVELPLIEAPPIGSLQPRAIPTQPSATNHDSSVPVMGVDGFRDYDAVTERFSGITGSGIAVGVLDTALNTSHVDIAHGRENICGANFVTDQDWDLWVDLHGHPPGHGPAHRGDTLDPGCRFPGHAPGEVLPENFTVT